MHLTSNHFLRLLKLETAQPGESQARAGGESVSGDSESQGSGGPSRALELGRKNDLGSGGPSQALELGQKNDSGSGGPSQAFELGGENDSGSGGPSQAFELERKNDSERKVTWLRKLMRRFGKRQRA